MNRTKVAWIAFALVSVSGLAFAACKSDCRAEYDSAREDCNSSYEDADDLQSCLEDAQSDYENCTGECDS
jgi:hypothetical protein